MALLHCEFFGKAIAKMSSLNILYPEGLGRGPFPVLYLLHGLTDNHTAWQRRSNIERYVDGLPLIVVMPDGHRSFYLDGPENTAALKYESHIAHDVVEFIDNTFHTIRLRTGRALAGLSMGGYGAIMLALRHPGRFCAASSHSGAVGLGHVEDGIFSSHNSSYAHAYADGKYNVFALAERAARLSNRPALRLDCGVDDYLIEHNRLFRKHLKRLKYPCLYKEYPGEHTWDYWDAHIRESIDFVMQHMKQ